MTKPCIDCDQPEIPSGRGSCDWTLCPNEADVVLPPGMVKRRDTGKQLTNIRLCAGHYRHAMSKGRLNLDWPRVFAAGG